MSGYYVVAGVGTGARSRVLSAHSQEFIGRLMQVEQRRGIKIEWNQARWEARVATWKNTNQRLTQLGAAASALVRSAHWYAPSSATSSNSGAISVTQTGTGPSAAGTYSIGVSQLAQTCSWQSSTDLADSVNGVRATGTWYDGLLGLGGTADETTKLTDVSDALGLPLGIIGTSVFTLSASTASGGPVSDTFSATATSTLGDLRDWANTVLPTSSIEIVDGQLVIDSGPGTANEVTSFQLSATGLLGLPNLLFNLSSSASSSLVTAAFDGGLTQDDTIQITQGATTWNLSVFQGDTEESIATRFNAMVGSSITASVSGGLLSFQAADMGAAGAFTLSSSTALAELGLAQQSAGQDAQFTVNGVAYARATNTGISDVIDGVSLDLLGVTGGTPATITTTAEQSANPLGVLNDVRAFVEQYNSLLKSIHDATSQERVHNPTTREQYVAGSLAHDRMLTSISLDLRTWAHESVSGQPLGTRTLADIGITSQSPLGDTASSPAGTLYIDEAKLKTALADRPDDVTRLFTTFGNAPGHVDDGIAVRVEMMVQDWRLSGMVDLAIDGASMRIQQAQRSMEQFTRRLDGVRARYERMFAATDQLLSRMQEQSAMLSTQFQSLRSAA